MDLNKIKRICHLLGGILLLGIALLAQGLKDFEVCFSCVIIGINMLVWSQNKKLFGWFIHINYAFFIFMIVKNIFESSGINWIDIICVVLLGVAWAIHWRMPNAITAK